MIIEIEMPMMGTWYEDTKRGSPNDIVRALPLPFNVSYHACLVSKDVDKGTITYVYDIDEAGVDLGILQAIRQFVNLPDKTKRKQIATLKAGPIHYGKTSGTFRKKKEADNAG